MSEDTGNVTSIVKVTFDGDELEALRRDGRVWVVLKRVCEALGINFASQLQKLRGMPWAVVVIIATTGPDGKCYEMACIDLDTLAGMLFKLTPSKVRLEHRDKVIRYQCDCTPALRAVFLGEAAPPPPMASKDELRAMMEEVVASMLPRILSPGPSDGVIGHEEARKIRAELMAVALIDADGNARAARGRRTKHDNELRSSLQFFGSCRSWDMLPRDKLGAVTVLLQEIRKRVRDEAARRNQARQGTLFSVPNTGAR